MAIRAVVFDLFDTLVDLDRETMPVSQLAGHAVPSTVCEIHERVRGHREVAPETFVALLREVDSDLRKSHFAQHLEVPTSLRFGNLTERLGLASPELTDALVETHMRGLRRQVRWVDHHAGLVAWLRARVPVAICSNFSHSPTALGILADGGLADHLDAIVISDAVGIRKPRQEIFQVVLDALGTAPAEVLHVGDSLEADVRGAAALGMRTAWVTRRVPRPDEALARYDGPRPDWRIADLAELRALVESSVPGV